MGHTAVSATQASSITLQIWQHGAIENYCNFAFFNRLVDKKISIIQNGAKYITFWLENESKEVQAGKDQEKAQSEKDSHSKNRGGKKQN